MTRRIHCSISRLRRRIGLNTYTCLRLLVSFSRLNTPHAHHCGAVALACLVIVTRTCGSTSMTTRSKEKTRSLFSSYSSSADGMHLPAAPNVSNPFSTRNLVHSHALPQEEEKGAKLGTEKLAQRYTLLCIFAPFVCECTKSCRVQLRDPCRKPDTVIH